MNFRFSCHPRHWIEFRERTATNVIANPMDGALPFTARYFVMPDITHVVNTRGRHKDRGMNVMNNDDTAFSEF